LAKLQLIKKLAVRLAMKLRAPGILNRRGIRQFYKKTMSAFEMIRWIIILPMWFARLRMCSKIDDALREIMPVKRLTEYALSFFNPIAETQQRNFPC
jgi:hypothetical protein